MFVYTQSAEKNTKQTIPEDFLIRMNSGRLANRVDWNPAKKVGVNGLLFSRHFKFDKADNSFI